MRRVQSLFLIVDLKILNFIHFLSNDYRKEWDIETELKDELYKLRECRSDAIFI